MADHAGLKLQPLDYVQHQCWGLDRMRRGGGEKPSRLRPGRQHRLLDRLPAFGRQVSARRGEFLKLPFSDQTKRKYLWDNCARLYRFGH